MAACLVGRSVGSVGNLGNLGNLGKLGNRAYKAYKAYMPYMPLLPLPQKNSGIFFNTRVFSIQNAKFKIILT